MESDRLPFQLSRDVKPNLFPHFELSKQRLSLADHPTTRNFAGLHAPSSASRSRSDSCREEESDDDLFRVPDLEAPRPVPKAGLSSATAVTAAIDINSSNSVDQQEKRRRTRNPADKEYRRLKRLLRNRVSAQQARERKKVYVNDLEAKASELQEKNAKLEEKISTLTNENAMLRKVLMNSRPKLDENAEFHRGLN